MPLFMFRINTPFPILGTATLETAGVRVIGRIPIGPTGFFACWLLAWTVGGIALGASKPFAGLGLVAFGLGLCSRISAFSISLELDVSGGRKMRCWRSWLAAPPNNRWRVP